MSQTIGQTIADSLKLSIGYGERLLKNVSAEQFARFATNADGPIESNHGAFIYGHLSLYAPSILTDLGASSLEVPDGFDQVFSKDAQCVDDPDAAIYPSMDVVTDFFFTGYKAALEALSAASDEQLQAANPNERMAERFPTMASMHNFYVGGHVMLHMGQMSAWRRMLGLGAA